MFSDTETAEFINRNFEPVWVSVRKVPKFTLDFGNGKVIHRTIYGNTATVISTAGGDVLDVLPGLYNPTTYRKSLEQTVLLARYANATTNLDHQKLRNYHRTVFQEISAKKNPSQLVAHGNEVIVRSVAGKLPVAPSPNDLLVENPNIGSHREVLQWKSLVAETTYNETVRRRSIHEHLARGNVKHGTEFTKWIYKTALHADLDDPYLGLAPVLFAAYPFND